MPPGSIERQIFGKSDKINLFSVNLVGILCVYWVKMSRQFANHFESGGEK
jgi:hypothetical protein